jgi:predicted amidohydrolase
MRIAILQGPVEAGEKSRQLTYLADAARRVAADGAKLLVAPEMFLTGYNIGRAAARELAEAVDGPSSREAARIARETGVALAYGYPELGADGKVYNAAQLIGPDGARLLNYRKTHLFGDLDRSMFAPGPGEFPVATLHGVKIGLLICYDVEFPEPVRLLALAGADLVAVPTAQMEPYEVVQRRLVPMRAFENQVFLAYANHCGREGEIVYYGESVISAPDGTELVRAGREEAVLVADLDPAAQKASRALFPYLTDRRPEIYRRLAAPSAE